MPVMGFGNVFRRWWEVVRKLFVREPVVVPAPTSLASPRRVVLTEGVQRTLFEEYAAHRRTERGNEETGWILMGLRRENEVLVQATLPAGTQSDTGVAHVLFNSRGQEIGSRIVRQEDRRLSILGVVHTHPGNLDHPSGGDLEGDREWVRACRGDEGIFGIGTAAGGELRFNWFTLRTGERSYHPLTPETMPGDDLARPLHEVWPIIEEYAPALQRLYGQQVGLSCQVIDHDQTRTLAVLVPLAKKGDWVRVLLTRHKARYLVKRGEQLFEVDPETTSVDKGVDLLLTELTT